MAKKISKGISTEKPKKRKTDGPSIEVRYPESFNILYANNTNLMMSNWDLMMDFGMLQPEMPGIDKGKISVLVHTRVIMSPQHAKKFLIKALDLIKSYEKDFGEIHADPQEK